MPLGTTFRMFFHTSGLQRPHLVSVWVGDLAVGHLSLRFTLLSSGSGAISFLLLINTLCINPTRYLLGLLSYPVQEQVTCSSLIYHCMSTGLPNIHHYRLPIVPCVHSFPSLCLFHPIIPILCLSYWKRPLFLLSIETRNAPSKMQIWPKLCCSAYNLVIALYNP